MKYDTLVIIFIGWYTPNAPGTGGFLERELATMALKDNKIISYFLGSRDELKKVSWPSRKVTVRSTINVVIMTLVVAALLGLMDFFLNIGLENILQSK